MHTRFFRAFVLLALLFLAAPATQAQTGSKPVTLEDIWSQYRFFARSAGDLQWMADDRFYTDLTDKGLVQFDVATGKEVATLVPASALTANGQALRVTGYYFPKSGPNIIFHANTVGHYRHSRSHSVYVWDGQKLTAVAGGTVVRQPMASPDGSKVGYVKNNNLYYTDLATGQEVQITTDGKANEIINGHTDWVYEEEFSFPEGFYWSPDSRRIAFYRFDERKVPLYTMDMYGPLYPRRHEFKYPKAGEPNSQVSIHLYNLEGKQTTRVETGDPSADQYIPRVQWTEDANTLALIRMNRHQNQAELLLADASTGQTRVVLTEKSDTWLDIDQDMLLRFLPGGQELIWASDRDGFRHLYLYRLDGKPADAKAKTAARQLTKGNWEITDYYGYDPATKTLFYQSTEDGSTRRRVYAQSLDGKRKVNLTPGAMTWNNASFSSNLRYFILRANNPQTPTVTSLHSADGKQLRVYEDNAALRNTLSQYRFSWKQYRTLTAANGQQLNSYMILPPDFDSTRKYPVLMFVYGGPGSQQVTEEWDNSLYHMTFNVLASKGYIIACVDNRGTGGRGRDFKKATYLNLGKLETEDQIASAQALGKLAYVDASRIGIFGWSYGGYMALLGITKGADVFKTSVAVAPVTNWRYYDTIYTERFLRTPQENAQGYDQNSPINFTNNFKGKLLLIHGTGDDNVHYQNSLEFVNAMVRSGKQFETFFYPNRSHGIGGGNTRHHLFTQMMKFLEGNL